MCKQAPRNIHTHAVQIAAALVEPTNLDMEVCTFDTCYPKDEDGEVFVVFAMSFIYSGPRLLCIDIFEGGAVIEYRTWDDEAGDFVDVEEVGQLALSEDYDLELDVEAIVECVTEHAVSVVEGNRKTE